MLSARLRPRFERQRSATLTRVVYRGWTPEKVVLLAGSQRSGTTWLAETLNHSRRFRYVFEPLGSHRSIRQLGLRSRCYLRPEHRDAAHERTLAALLAGDMHNRWIDGFEDRSFWRPRPNLLVKCVALNPLVPWVARRFPDVYLVHEIRHPAAVAESRMSLGWPVDGLYEMLAQPALVDDHLRPYLRTIDRLGTELERHVAMWCIEQLVPQRGVETGRLRTVFYEDVALRPHTELPRLLASLDETFDAAVLDSVEESSLTDMRRRDGDPSTLDRVSSWRRRLSASDIAAVSRVVDDFGLGHLYDADGRPSARTG